MLSQVIVTEADRATARRVIRRFAGVGTSARIDVVGTYAVTPQIERRTGERVIVRADVVIAAVEAAAQGRAYAAALRGAK